MNNKPAMLIASFVSFVILADVARGGTFRFDWEVASVNNVYGFPMPTIPLTGSVTWEAAGIREPIQLFDSIDLTLDGHTYGVGEIGYRQSDFPFVGIELIGGTLTGINSILEDTDDFWLRWDRN
jgi:hypothetical protein